FAHRNKLYPLWDAQVVFDLVDHPEVVASRARRGNRMTPKKRKRILSDLVESWDTSGSQLIGLVIKGYKSIDDIYVPLKGTTVLLGKNGSGKTNILEAVAAEVGSESIHGRFRDSGPREPPTGPSAFAEIYELMPQSEERLESFLESYLHRFDDGVVSDLKPILTNLLRAPLVADWRDRTAAFRMIRSGLSRVALDLDESVRAPVSERTLNYIRKDPWLSKLCEHVARAPNGVGIVAELPSWVILPPLDIAVVDGDPRRLLDEIETRLPDLAPHAADDVDPKQRFLDEYLPRDDEGDDPDWPVELEPRQPVWLSWMAAPGPKTTTEVLDLAQLSDPDVHLDEPSADTVWIVAGRGSRMAGNAFGAAAVTDRRAVRELFRRAMLVVQRWYDERDEAADGLPSDHWLWSLIEDGRAISDALGLDLWSESDAPDRGSAWLGHTNAGTAIRQELLVSLSEVELLANQIAPPFVRTRGRIVLNVLPPATWAQTGRRISIRFATEGNRLLELSDLGRGTQRWAAASIREALRVVSMRAGTEAKGTGPSLLLVDEPEMALHPDAQDQVAQWCVRAGRSGQRVLVATHSPSMLELSPSDASLVKVSIVRGMTHVEPLDAAALEGLDQLASSLGLGRSGLLHLPRGFVIVEGPADAAVLNGLLGADLRQQRIIPIPLHGAYKYRALVQPEFFRAIGKPMAVMYDDVRREVLDGERPAETDEEKTLLKLVERVPEIQPISFDAPDIVAALPDDAMRRVVPDFPGWDEILDRWQEKPGDFKNFKAYAMHRCGRSEREATPFIMEVLEQWQPDDVLPTSFRRAASEILAWADSISSIGSVDVYEEDVK
ncbi:MAG: AAA family ATPase, partial [Actinomycetia bacterium]|nr:AAA family ATPase [Actinomycetes bacterium]